MEKLIKIPPNILSFYVNFTSPSNLKITKANHEESNLVRKISVVNRYKTVTVLLMPTALRMNTSDTFNIFLLTEDAEPNTDYNIKLTIELNSVNAKFDTFIETEQNSTIKNETNETESSVIKTYPIKIADEPIVYPTDSNYQNVNFIMILLIF